MYPNICALRSPPLTISEYLSYVWSDSLIIVAIRMITIFTNSYILVGLLVAFSKL